MTYQSAYLNIQLSKELSPKKAYSLTIDLNLKELLNRAFNLVFASPALKRSIGPGQTKQVVSRDLRHYPV